MIGRVRPARRAHDHLGSDPQDFRQQNTAGCSPSAFVLTVWSSSGALVSIITTLNAAYDITEGAAVVEGPADRRSASTLGMAVFILAVAGAGARRARRSPSTWRRAAPRPGVQVDLVDPAVAGRVRAGVDRDWPRLLLRAGRRTGLGVDHAGSIVATVLWLLVSLGFKLYISLFRQLQRDLRRDRRGDRAC